MSETISVPIWVVLVPWLAGCWQLGKWAALLSIKAWMTIKEDQ